MQDPDASSDLGNNPAAECDLLSGFDQVDLHQTGQVRPRGELLEDRGDSPIAVGRGPQPLGVHRLQGGPRLIDPLTDVCRLRMRGQGRNQAMHRLVPGDRAGVGHQELTVDQLRHVVLGLGLADLVVHQRLGHSLQRRPASGTLERRGEIRALVDSDEVIGPAVVAQPGLGQTQPTGRLVKAGIRLVHKDLAEPRVPLDGLGQRPQVVHVEPAVASVPLPGMQVQPGVRVDDAGGTPGEQTERRGSGRRPAEVRHQDGLDPAALRAVRLLLPDLEGLVDTR